MDENIKSLSQKEDETGKQKRQSVKELGNSRGCKSRGKKWKEEQKKREESEAREEMEKQREGCLKIKGQSLC